MYRSLFVVGCLFYESHKCNTKNVILYLRARSLMGCEAYGDLCARNRYQVQGKVITSLPLTFAPGTHFPTCRSVNYAIIASSATQANHKHAIWNCSMLSFTVPGINPISMHAYRSIKLRFPVKNYTWYLMSYLHLLHFPTWYFKASLDKVMVFGFAIRMVGNMILCPIIPLQNTINQSDLSAIAADVMATHVSRSQSIEKTVHCLRWGWGLSFCYISINRIYLENTKYVCIYRILGIKWSNCLYQSDAASRWPWHSGICIVWQIILFRLPTDTFIIWD